MTPIPNAVVYKLRLVTPRNHYSRIVVMANSRCSDNVVI
jgi:hypothetical protein